MSLRKAGKEEKARIGACRIGKKNGRNLKKKWETRSRGGWAGEGNAEG
jgi:hypothetical protein